MLLQGGRVASSVAHAHPDATLGCIFFSYPLHPPNKQASPQRASHLLTKIYTSYN